MVCGVWVNRAFSILLFCTLLKGCADSAVLLDGPGTEFYANDTSERTRLEDEYFKLMCLGAGLANGDCPQRSDKWIKVVYVALNDIDDRCELYISSLARAKREGDGYIAQLTRTAATTAVVLGQTLDKKSKSDARAVSIVQAAFGLGNKSLTSYYSRLLLAIPPTTVQQIALKRQTAFRVALQKAAKVDGTTVDTRADAYFVIRSYLRICLPQSLEASIGEGLEDLSFPPTEQQQSLERAVVSQKAPKSRRVDPDVNALSARR